VNQQVTDSSLLWVPPKYPVVPLFATRFATRIPPCGGYSEGSEHDFFRSGLHRLLTQAHWVERKRVVEVGFRIQPHSLRFLRLL
jgi:hypothetical protein